MAIVEQLQPPDAPVVSVQLTLKEARGLVTLLGSGLTEKALEELDLDGLYTSLNMLYPEYQRFGFYWSAELEYIEKD